MNSSITIGTPVAPAATVAGSPSARMYALDFLRFGLLAAVLAYMPGEMLFTDGHTFPAELILHLFAAGAALLCLWRATALRVDAIDACLGGFLVLSALSSANAGNPWFAFRAFGLTFSGLLVFWAARALARTGRRRELLAFATVGVVAAAVTALLEAYGVVGDLSAVNRAPGGTIGNRNQMAHLLVLGTPVLMMHVFRARRRAHLALLVLVVAALAAAVVLARSRAAWLALSVLGAVGLVAMIRFRGHGLSAQRDRLGLVAFACIAGVGAATNLPNALAWNSATPYSDSFRGVVNFEYGSGRGRLIQYANTLGMVRDHALLGVGPGNWSIAYPRYATPGDPSYDPRSPRPTTQLPQSDWVGIAAERGLPALVLLLAAGALIVLRSARTVRSEASPREAGRAFAAIGTLAALAVIGVVDPVLLTPTATFLVFLTLGALVEESARAQTVALRPARRSGAYLVVSAASLALVVQAGRQSWAGHLYATGFDLDALEAATRVNPADYRAHMLLADGLVRARRCADAERHIAAAERLFPTAPAPSVLRRRCLADAGGGG